MSIKRSLVKQTHDGTSKKPKLGENSKKPKKPMLDEKPENWKEFKQQKKDLLLKRKRRKAGDTFQLLAQAKKIGERLRSKALKKNPAERDQITNQLHQLLKSKQFYSKVVVAHDTSRIVQWMLKYGTAQTKSEIVKDLLPSIVSLTQSKYGVFVMHKILRYASVKDKRQVVSEFYGHVVKLSSHNIAAPLLEIIYTTVALPTEKIRMQQEFYGDLYRNSKADHVTCIADVFKNNPEMKAATMSAVKHNLMKVISKNLLDSTLVHTVLLQFLDLCEAQQDRAEMIKNLASLIVMISNSKDGVKVAMQIIWQGTNKDKKVAMKAVKEHIHAVACHAHAHKALITLLDATDDTVLLSKIVLSELLKDISALAKNEYGRKVLMWLVAPFNTKCSHKVFLEELETGRKSSNCKKAATVRREEILDYSIEPLLNHVALNSTFWLDGASVAFVMARILLAGHKKGEAWHMAATQVAAIVTNPSWKISIVPKVPRSKPQTTSDNIESPLERNGIEDNGMHMVLKELLKFHVNDQNTNSDEPDNSSFGTILMKSLTEDVITVWTQSNRGCFLLLTLFQSISDPLKADLAEKLQPVSKYLKSVGKTSAGAQLLLDNIRPLISRKSVPEPNSNIEAI